MNAPILLFVYSRPEHTRRTVEALLKNPEAKDSDLIVFADAARTADKEEAVVRVRDYVHTIHGFRSVSLRLRPENYGLSKSIVEGVNEVLASSDQVIVLEDDMVTSPHFLRYMNDALDQYRDDERVISAHAYVYPVDQPLPEAFFLDGADCWGWATWRRGWEHFQPDGQLLYQQLQRRNLLKKFDFNGSYKYSSMLRDQVVGRNSSWAILWYASAFLANKLTLYPGRSLVTNIGNDASGTHCGDMEGFDAELSSRPIDLKNIQVEPSIAGRKAFETFFCDLRRRSVRRKLRQWAEKLKGSRGS